MLKHAQSCFAKKRPALPTQKTNHETHSELETNDTISI